MTGPDVGRRQQFLPPPLPIVKLGETVIGEGDVLFWKQRVFWPLQQSGSPGDGGGVLVEESKPRITKCQCIPGSAFGERPSEAAAVLLGDLPIGRAPRTQSH